MYDEMYDEAWEREFERVNEERETLTAADTDLDDLVGDDAPPWV